MPAVAVEQVAVTIGGGVVTEVGRASDEGTVVDGADDDVADLHRLDVVEVCGAHRWPARMLESPY
jgi:hypothetical protein